MSRADYKAQAKSLRAQLKWAEERAEVNRKSADQQCARADRYRAKLAQLLKDAGKHSALNSEYVASLIGELI